LILSVPMPVMMLAGCVVVAGATADQQRKSKKKQGQFVLVDGKLHINCPAVLRG